MKTIINKLVTFLSSFNLFSRIKATRGVSLKNVFALFSVIDIDTRESQKEK